MYLLKCGLRNFKRRDRCFKCSMSREGLKIKLYGFNRIEI
jgi:hypothetical protein